MRFTKRKTVQISFSFISLIEYTFSASDVDALLVFACIFYILTLLFSIRGIIICIKSWICQANGNEYKISILEQILTYIVLIIIILLFVLWFILHTHNGIKIYYGAVVFAVITILNIVFLDYFN